MKQSELYKKLYEKLGADYQLEVLQEELSELSQAISKYKRHIIKKEKFGDVEGNLELIIKNITDETADVKVALIGMIHYFNIANQVYQGQQLKLKRTEERAKKYLK